MSRQKSRPRRCRHLQSTTEYDETSPIWSRCVVCRAQLSIGPANESQPPIRLLQRGPSERSLQVGFDWDPSRPLAEQWPWRPMEQAELPAVPIAGDASVIEADAPEAEEADPGPREPAFDAMREMFGPDPVAADLDEAEAEADRDLVAAIELDDDDIATLEVPGCDREDCWERGECQNPEACGQRKIGGGQ